MRATDLFTVHAPELEELASPLDALGHDSFCHLLASFFSQRVVVTLQLLQCARLGPLDPLQIPDGALAQFLGGVDSRLKAKALVAGPLVLRHKLRLALERRLVIHLPLGGRYVVRSGD